MPIGAIAPVLPAPPADKLATPPPKAPFEPAPPLRPTLQDKIEITRALMELRQVS